MSFQQSGRDIKTVIAKFLNDRDILNYCIIDKNQHGNVCNEKFFYNVLLSRYPDTLKYKPDDINFKKWYLSVIHYVDLLNREFGFDYRKYNEGNPERQYEIFRELEELKDKKDMDVLLFLAARHGELSLVRFALDNGADINVDDDLPLRRASEKGHLEVVQYLVKNGADIHDDALLVASGNGHLAVVQYLVEHGANIHAYEDITLQLASYMGHLEVVKYLVQHGANIHASNDQALNWAKEHKHWGVVNYLESLT